MTRSGAPHGVLTRIRRPLMGAAAALTAALVVGLIGSSSTYASWHDTVAIPAVTITSGEPALSVDGFTGLDQEYSLFPLVLTAEAEVTVTNEGNVPLSGFEATAHAGSGVADLLNELSLEFTPSGGGAAVGIDGWLSGLTLAPGESVRYTAQTSILSGALISLMGTQATTYVDVVAFAGTSWEVGDESHFVQAIGTTVVDPAPDFNTWFVYPNYPAAPWPSYGVTNFGFAWGTEGHNIPQGTGWLIYTDDFLVLQDQGPHPQHSVFPQDVNPAVWPAVGQTKMITIVVKPNINGWDQGNIAQLTVWMTNVDGTTAYFYPTDPSAAAAAAPQAMTWQTDAGPAGAAPQPAPAPEAPAAPYAPDAPAAASPAPEPLPAPDTAATPGPGQQAPEPMQPAEPDPEGIPDAEPTPQHEGGGAP